jgi:hypothetical protein
LTDVVGLNGGNVLVMQGAYGQEIVMDMDSSQIVVINTGESNHQGTKKLANKLIKYVRI